MINEISGATKVKRSRDKIIRAWLSDDEYKLLIEKCEKSGMTISCFVRKIITEGEIKHYDTYAINEIVQELNSIGNDISGIAKKANERGSVIEEDNANLKEQYERLMNMYLEKIMGIE